MADPVLHLLAGPNGAGKSTFFERVLEPELHLDFVNADRIAAVRWPGAEEQHGHEASQAAASERATRLASGRSFVSETVFSHRSKVELVEAARHAGFLVTLHVVVVPVELAVARVQLRVDEGGHSVPEAKVRERFARLWPLVAEAVVHVDEAHVYDNATGAQPFRVLASFDRGRAVAVSPGWPVWVPAPLCELVEESTDPR